MKTKMKIDAEFNKELDEFLVELMDVCKEEGKGIIFIAHLEILYKYILDLYSKYEFVDFEIMEHVEVNYRTLILTVGSIRLNFSDVIYSSILRLHDIERTIEDGVSKCLSEEKCNE